MTASSSPIAFRAMVAGLFRIARATASGLVLGRPGGVERPALPYQTRRTCSWTSDMGTTTITNVGFNAAPTVLGTPTGGATTNRNLIIFTTAASIGATGGLVPALYQYTRRSFAPTLVQTIRTQTSIADVVIWAGLFSADPTASGTAAGHVAAFRYATDVDGTAFWRCITRDNSTTTTTTTTYAIATATEYVLRIEILGSRVEFYIDDVLVADHTTNLPGNTTVMGPAVTITALAASAKGLRWGSTTLVQAA